MAEDKYSSNESLDRIARLLMGETVSESAESLPPPKRSSDESLSTIAELLNGTLEGEQAFVPIGMNSYGMIYENATGLTTGTYLSSGTWTYIGLVTGTQAYNVTETHGAVTNILTTSKQGVYLIGYNVSFAGTKDAEYEFALYSNAQVLAQSYTRLTLRATGTYHSVGTAAIDDMAASEVVGVIVRSSTHNAGFAVKDGQMWMKSL